MNQTGLRSSHPSGSIATAIVVRSTSANLRSNVGSFKTWVKTTRNIVSQTRNPTIPCSTRMHK